MLKQLLVLAAATSLTACLGTTVPTGHAGLKYIALDDGGLEKKVRPEGFYFQWWWNDIIIYDVTWQTRNEKIEVLTADDLHVPTSVAVTFRPRVKELYRLHTEIGRTYYRDVIQPAFVTLARSEFALHRHNDLAKKGPAVEQAILTKLRKLLKGKPLDIDRVTISHIRFDRAVTNSISTKLVKEQASRQKHFEVEIARQDAEIDRTRAQGKADATKLQAEGDAAAIVLRGKAQAEAQQAISKTLDKRYLQYKAFDSKGAQYYFVPIGKDGLPLIINADRR